MITELTRRDALKLTGAAAVLATTKVAVGRAQDEAPTATASLGMAFEGGRYKLPDLPYPTEALEPLYDKTTLMLHHGKHHAGYVRGANSTLDALAAARKAGDYGQIKALCRALAFHGSGHVLHEGPPARPGGPRGLRRPVPRQAVRAPHVGRLHRERSARDDDPRG